MSFEKSKSKTINIQKMDEMLADRSIRVDHPDQRLAEQWVAEYRDNLVADVLWDNPISQIILCEQKVNALAPTYWLIDGKQRSTNLVKFRRGLFKIGSKVDRPFIEYVHVGENDEPTIETFDVRKKYYKDLPKELQRRFDGYELRAEMYLDCTDDDIDYHIRRYNRVKPMTAAQKGILYLGTETSKVVKRLAQHNFFRDGIGKYSATDLKNGAVDRIITDSVMTINFLPNWKKGNDAICRYLREHVTTGAFDQIEDYLNRLECVVTEDVQDLFDNKSSFIFFSLFDRFTKYGRDDEEFVEFLRAFKDGMMEVEVDGTSYATLCELGTKDKKTIAAKLNLLESLMCEYLHINKEEIPSDIKIADRNLLAMEEEFTESDLVKEAGLTAREIRTAMLRYISDDELLADELQDFVCRANVTEEDIEDVGLDLDMLFDWLKQDASKINADNLPRYLRFVDYAKCEDLPDEKVIECLTGMSGTEAYDVMVAMVSDQTAA